MAINFSRCFTVSIRGVTLQIAVCMDLVQRISWTNNTTFWDSDLSLSLEYGISSALLLPHRCVCSSIRQNGQSTDAE